MRDLFVCAKCHTIGDHRFTENGVYICANCERPVFEYTQWAEVEAAKATQEYASLKTYIAACGRPDVLAALRAKLYELGVRLP